MCAQQLARDSDLTLAGQLLVYPVLDDDVTRDSYRRNDGLVLGAREMGWFFDQYCPPDERRSPLFAPLRARDLVGLGLDGQRLGIPLPSARRRHQIDEMLQAVDAARFADTRVGLLSGGEQQRVLIAHALISRPRLLLLDEPLANLDIASEQDVVELLGGVAREQQVAVLISAHDMNPLLPVMDRIVYMAAGRAASGTMDG